MVADQLPHLETFASAAERSSFTAAARDLGLTQAAISQRIAALERYVGAALFSRQGGHVLLTEAGHRLYAYCRRILELHSQAIRELTGRQPPLTGELALAASSIPGQYLLPDLLSAFRKRHPEVQVRAAVTDTRDVLYQVEHGRAHVGLVGGRHDHPHLEFHGFARDRLLIVVPAGHAWRRRRQVPLSWLATQPLVLREPGSGSRWCLEQALAGAGTSLARMCVALELGSNEAIKEAVARGMGIAILSAHAVRKDLADGVLHGLGITGIPLEREMFVVRDRRRVLPIPAQLFLDLLRACSPGGDST